MRRVGLFASCAVVAFVFSQGALAQLGGGSSSNEHRIVPGAPPRAPAQTVFYAWCQTGGVPAPGGRGSSYISGIFLVDTAVLAHLPPGTKFPPWMSQFQQYVAEHYPHAAGAEIGVSCDNSTTESAAQARRDGNVRQQGAFPLVDTGWKFAPDPPIAPPSAVPAAAAATPPAAATAAAATPPATRAVAPSAAPTASPGAASPQAGAAPPNPTAATPQAQPATPKAKYVACWAEVKSRQSAYFSTVFEAPGVAEPREAFRTMVMTSYGGISRFACEQKGSSAEAEQQLQQWKDAARARDTIVETGWKP